MVKNDRFSNHNFRKLLDSHVGNVVSILREQAGDKIVKVIVTHLDRCRACKTCELYCAVGRGSNSKTLLKAIREVPTPKARLQVEGSNDVSLPMQCRHCQNAPCIDACLAGALVRDPETDMVIIREDRCVACWTCTIFCPYGAIYPSHELKMAIKCDRCNYMEHPICIDVCPTQALQLVDLDRYDEETLRSKRKNAVTLIHKDTDSDEVLLLDLH
jgi:anaerobic carbon-monoxide dehydrogenase iron sulfur subunit